MSVNRNVRVCAGVESVIGRDNAEGAQLGNGP
jgi:hypothetical protein